MAPLSVCCCDFHHKFPTNQDSGERPRDSRPIRNTLRVDREFAEYRSSERFALLSASSRSLPWVSQPSLSEGAGRLSALRTISPRRHSQIQQCASQANLQRVLDESEDV